MEIPGFSEYLHPYGDGKLLGIGMEVDEESVATEGVKLSMFDVSDPADVEEENKYILEGMYLGETFYLISANTIESYMMSDFEKVDDIVL